MSWSLIFKCASPCDSKIVVGKMGRLWLWFVFVFVIVNRSRYETWGARRKRPSGSPIFITDSSEAMRIKYLRLSLTNPESLGLNIVSRNSSNDIE